MGGSIIFFYKRNRRFINNGILRKMEKSQCSVRVTQLQAGIELSVIRKNPVSCP